MQRNILEMEILNLREINKKGVTISSNEAGFHFLAELKFVTRYNHVLYSAITRFFFLVVTQELRPLAHAQDTKGPSRDVSDIGRSTSYTKVDADATVALSNEERTLNSLNRGLFKT
jgi:hypothetical protein